MPDRLNDPDPIPSAASQATTAQSSAEPSGACRRCAQCEGEEHHWMYVGDEDEDGEPVMSCKHCDATRPVEDDDE